MNPFEEFSFDLYHAKLKLEAFKSGYTESILDNETQNQVNALSNLVSKDFEIEAHLIATQTHFGKQLAFKDILDHVSACLRLQNDNENKDAFTMCLFNRLNLSVKK